MYLFKLAFSFFCFRFIPRNGITGSYSNSVVVFFFLRNHPTIFPQWLHQFTRPPTMHRGSLLSTFSPPFVICVVLDDSHSDRYEVMYYCGFNLHFADVVMLSNLSCTCWPSVCLLWETIYSGLLPIFKLSCLFYWY